MLLKKNVFSSCLERGTKSLNEESNLAPSHSALWCSTSEPQELLGCARLVQGSFVTRDLFTTTGNVESLVLVNRIKKMVNFYVR